jgi:carboxymethylenebutenolidase
MNRFLTWQLMASPTVGLMLLLTPTLLSPPALGAQEKPPERDALVELTQERIPTGKTAMTVWRFARPGPHKRPALILLHGADGVQACFQAYRDIAEGFARAGSVVILIRYYDRTNTADTAGDKQRNAFIDWLHRGASADQLQSAREHFDEWMSAVADAVAYARRLPGVDGNRVALVGFSLGGYLAVAAAALQPELGISAVVELFGGIPRELHKRVKRLPPILILHGEDDDVVPVQEGEALLGLCQRRGCSVEFKFYPGVGHCFVRPGKSSPDLLTIVDSQARVLNFLNKHH